MGKYFGTDGFRGEAGVTLTATHAYRIGRFLGASGAGRRLRVAVGKDTRLSCYMLEYALIAGLTASGADAYVLHVTTTPNLCYTVAAEGFDLGVMITASHNPYQDNGIKLIGPDGAKADDALTDEIERYLDGAPHLTLPFATGSEIGRVYDHGAARERYLSYLISQAGVRLDGLRVGLDAANGAASALAPALFAALGADVYPIHTKPDGTNINRGAGALHIEALTEHVHAHSLDVGFAFDGDADRCIAVTAEGAVLNGDHMLYILANDLKARGKLKRDTVVVTVMSNFGLTRALQAMGGTTVESAVGDRFVTEKMREGDFSLGGEQAGHIIFADHVTGDGFLTALRLLAAAARAGKSLAALASALTLLPQHTCNLRVKDKRAVSSNAAVQAAVTEVREMLGNTGRVILRESGTEPVIRVMVEAAEDSLCQSLTEKIAAVIGAEGFLQEK
ncbi:MAG: phosphoglucosamine mutase [Clostridia bacterium]|nr:phosphoglucosamine mutase [Clostridia bacterium]